VSLPVAILAGGLATRLRPVTEQTPKALLDVAGKPFLVRQLGYLKDQGLDHVVICVGFLGNQIEEAIGDGSSFGLSVKYSQDWPQLLGTGGALRKALPLIGSEFFILYGDSYLPIDFRAVEQAFLTSGKPALMTVQRNVDRWDKSNVLFREKRIVEYNKRSPAAGMKHIDYGLGVMSADVLLKEDAAGPFDLADVYHKLSTSGRLAGYEIEERFYEIGSPKGLMDAVNYFEAKDRR
jgi:N-acetyl-alpha-D-muramate 1-phosphate uridylyltransferase